MKPVFLSLFLVFLSVVHTNIFGFERITVFTEFEDDKKYLYVVGELERDFRESPSNFFVVGMDFFLSVKLYRKNDVFFGRSEYSDTPPDFTELTCFFASEGDPVRLTAVGGVILTAGPPPVKYEIRQAESYEVTPGDYLYKIAQRNGSSVAALELINGLDDANIKPGQILKTGTINFKNAYLKLVVERDYCRMGVYYEDVLLRYFPVAVGRDDMTPAGTYRIMRKIENPALYWEGEYISPLAPINGLGNWWLELSNPQYGIHGTNKPWEIGKRISHGCIRMFNEDVANLQKIIPVGTEVTIR